MNEVAVVNNRPADILLPEGWTWDHVEEQRAKLGLSDDLIPVATAPGCVAWGTINSARCAIHEPRS